MKKLKDNLDKILLGATAIGTVCFAIISGIGIVSLSWGLIAFGTLYCGLFGSMLAKYMISSKHEKQKTEKEQTPNNVNIEIKKENTNQKENTRTEYITSYEGKKCTETLNGMHHDTVNQQSYQYIKKEDRY